MEIKRDKKADALANLYRSALYLARGNVKLGKFLAYRAGRVLNLDILRKIAPYSKSNKIMAEKVLDEYLRLKGKVLRGVDK